MKVDIFDKFMLWFVLVFDLVCCEMYSHLDWCEAGYQLGRLRENWTLTPFRLFVSRSEKIIIDNLFSFLHLKLKNKLFEVHELEEFYRQLALLSSEIEKVLKNLQC
jgi:hypothetical protein